MDDNAPSNIQKPTSEFCPSLFLKYPLHLLLISYLKQHYTQIRSFNG